MSAGVLVCLLLSGYVLAWPARAAVPRDKKAEAKHDGLIFGTVWDRNNQPVYGVRVKIRAASEKKARWEVYSNHVGEFEQLVPAGSYVVWADVKRPKKARKGDQGNHWSPQVTVQVQNDVRVDIGLHLTE
ncbi:MAG TPA: carboxypeptidase-like regulatory domain-containing protein [Terriglobales bacterium]|jgi:hypothetical protein|nr:carboxypeptidase-like regulatory domain-containing protein [Terriglobales bacterium]